MAGKRTKFLLTIKLSAHFKDEISITTINQLNKQVPFKIKTKEKYTPNRMHHVLRTCIDHVENNMMH